MTSDALHHVPAELATPLQWLGQARLAYYFELPEQTPSNNELKGMHFHAYRKLRARWKSHILQHGLKLVLPTAPITKAALLVERQCVGSLDWDNAFGGLKPLLDCLVTAKKANPDGLGLITDDNPKNMPFPPLMIQSKAARGEGRTRIWIYTLDEPT
jgi:hypothetical protein